MLFHVGGKDDGKNAYILLPFQHLIKMFLAAVKQVKLEVRPLFLPQLVRLTSMLRPGLYNINVR